MIWRRVAQGLREDVRRAVQCLGEEGVSASDEMPDHLRVIGEIITNLKKPAGACEVLSILPDASAFP